MTSNHDMHAPSGEPGEFAGVQGVIAIDDRIAERVLDDGSRHRVVKRFRLPDGFEAAMAELGRRSRAHHTEYFFFLAEVERLDDAGSSPSDRAGHGRDPQR